MVSKEHDTALTVVVRQLQDAVVLAQILREGRRRFADIAGRQDYYINTAKESSKACDFVGGVLYSAWAAMAMTVDNRGIDDIVKMIGNDEIQSVSRVDDQHKIANMIAQFCVCMYLEDWDIVLGERLFRRVVYYGSGASQMMYDSYADFVGHTRRQYDHLDDTMRHVYVACVRRALTRSMPMLRDAEVMAEQNGALDKGLMVARRRVYARAIQGDVTAAAVIPRYIDRAINLGYIDGTFREGIQNMMDEYQVWTEKLTEDINVLGSIAIERFEEATSEMMVGSWRYLPEYDLKIEQRHLRGGKYSKRLSLNS